MNIQEQLSELDTATLLSKMRELNRMILERQYSDGKGAPYLTQEHYITQLERRLFDLDRKDGKVR